MESPKPDFLQEKQPEEIIDNALESNESTKDLIDFLGQFEELTNESDWGFRANKEKLEKYETELTSLLDKAVVNIKNASEIDSIWESLAEISDYSEGKKISEQIIRTYDFSNCFRGIKSNLDEEQKDSLKNIFRSRYYEEDLNTCIDTMVNASDIIHTPESVFELLNKIPTDEEINQKLPADKSKYFSKTFISILANLPEEIRIKTNSLILEKINKANSDKDRYKRIHGQINTTDEETIEGVDALQAFNGFNDSKKLLRNLEIYHAALNVKNVEKLESDLKNAGNNQDDFIEAFNKYKQEVYPVVFENRGDYGLERLVDIGEMLQENFQKVLKDDNSSFLEIYGSNPNLKASEKSDIDMHLSDDVLKTYMDTYGYDHKAEQSVMEWGQSIKPEELPINRQFQTIPWRKKLESLPIEQQELFKALNGAAKQYADYSKMDQDYDPSEVITLETHTMKTGKDDLHARGLYNPILLRVYKNKITLLIYKGLTDKNTSEFTIPLERSHR